LVVTEGLVTTLVMAVLVLLQQEVVAALVMEMEAMVRVVS
tara:strand:- start:180 stop:299 length:120 start_codon:yes stop_codon:yes gene_type:complete